MQKQHIIRKINSLADELRSTKLSQVSLLGGLAGLAVFYGHLYLYKKKSIDLKECHKIVAELMAQMEGHARSYTIASGDAGVIWALNHLRKIGLLEFDPNFLFDNVENSMYDSSLQDLKKGDYDFLHGGTGPMLYALSRSRNRKAANYLKECIVAIDKLKETTVDGVRWNDLRNHSLAFKYNLGLSHGIPSILFMLVRLFEKKIEKERVRNLASETIKWIISCRHLHGGKHSIYPIAILASGAHQGTESRLGWCYGDLTIGTTFWKAGKVMREKTWVSEATTLFSNSLSRIDPLLDDGLDPGFCHGTSGIAYIFHKIYNDTGEIAYKRRRDFWLEKTFELSKFPDGIAGFKSYRKLEPSGWVYNPGLLEGAAGIGLSLLGCIGASTSWDECLLLS